MSSRERLTRWIHAQQPSTLILALAVLLAISIYAPTLGHGLTNYDDPWLIGDNLLLQQPSWALLDRVFFDLSSATRFQLGAEYLPVRDLSVMVDFMVWGDWYGGHHLTNLVLYLVGAALWYAALASFGFDRRLVAVAVLLWIVHPSHAESVAWLSERKGLLGLAFSGATAWMYGRYRVAPRWRTLIAAVVFAVLAIWSKAPSAFAIAALAPLELVAPRARVSVARVLGGLAALAVFSGLAFVPVFQTAMGLTIVGTEDRAPAHPVTMALGIHGHYLQVAAMVVRNAISYPMQTDGPSVVQVALGAVGVVIAIAAVVVRTGWWRPPLAVRAGAVLWLVGLVPASRIVLPLKAVLVSDRYLLFPSLGFALVLATLVTSIPRLRIQRALVAVLVLSSSMRAFDAQTNWRDDETLWQRAVLSNPNDGDAWSGYAEALQRNGRFQQAAIEISQGLRHSRAPRLLFRKALFAVAYGKRPVALAAMEEAAEAGEPRAMSNLAQMLIEDGRYEEALSWARKAVDKAPLYGRAHRNLGTAALKLRRIDDAYTALKRAYELWPHSAINRYNFAVALVERQELDVAREHLAACMADPTVRMQAMSLLAQIAKVQGRR